MAQRHLYLRDYIVINRQNGEEQDIIRRPIGCLTVELHREANEIHYGYSVCSPLDNWDAVIAREIAVGRLAKKPLVIKGIPATGHAITEVIMRDIIANNEVQSSKTSRSALARQAAQGWLEYAQYPTKTGG